VSDPDEEALWDQHEEDEQAQQEAEDAGK